MADRYGATISPAHKETHRLSPRLQFRCVRCGIDVLVSRPGDTVAADATCPLDGSRLARWDGPPDPPPPDARLRARARPRAARPHSRRRGGRPLRALAPRRAPAAQGGRRRSLRVDDTAGLGVDLAGLERQLRTRRGGGPVVLTDLTAPGGVDAVVAWLEHEFLLGV
jgi:hypothetical protein